MNKLRTIWLSCLFLGVLTLASCAKSSDLGRMQDDATTMAKGFRPRVEDLQRRSDLLLQRGRTLTAALPGIADAGRVLGEAKTKIEQLKGTLDASPAAVQAGAKTGDAEELEKLMDELHDKVVNGIIEANAELDAVDSWLAAAETTKPPVATPVPPPPTGEVSVPPAGAGSAATK